MCAACRSPKSSRSLWSFSSIISSTSPHWDGPITFSELPPSGSRHSRWSNSRSTRSQRCIRHYWPPPLTSFTTPLGQLIRRHGLIFYQLDSKRSSIGNNNNWGLCDQKVSQAGINNYIQQSTVGCNYLSLPEIPEKSALRISCYTRWLKNTYELLNLRTLKYLPVNKIYIFQCIGKIFCV